MVFAARPHIELVAIAPGHHAHVIDDALADPRRWIDLAARHRADFARSPHNAFPGPELRLPESFSARLGEYFSQHVRSKLGARRIERCYSRLSLATLQPAQLEPRQWIAHRDMLEPEPGRLTAACVLYLFEDEALGGTAFFVPKRPLQETRLLVHESGRLDRAAFTAKYGIGAGYMTSGNDWFEKTASIAPRFNRLVFYDGGAVFHTSDIAAPSRLSDDPRTGRLTLNGFFVCKANAS
jgi:hypothetical protein